MKKYDNYKDSGIEWIGEIPEHWNINRLRNIADSIKTGSTPPSEEIQYFEPKDINWYGPGDFDDLILYDAKRKISNLSIKENKCRLFPPNSILLIGIGATVGKVGIVSEASTSNQQINAIILKNEYNPKYYTYFISTIKDIIVMEASSATLPIFNQTQTKNIVLPVPEIFEQTTIANYLDHKTTQIDTLIFKKQQFITLLQEERTAVINQAVTKGLDPKVKMKDSGIEWLGEIPEHWKLMRVGSLSQCITGFAFKSDNFSFENGIKIVRGDNVTENSLRWGDKTRYWNEYSEVLDRFQLQKNDIVIGMDGSKVGKNYAYVEEKDLPLLLVQRVARIRSNSELIAKWIHFNIGTYNFKYYINLSKTDPAIPHITLKNITSYPICIPDINELNLIIEKLNSKLEKLDETLKKSKQEIELLKEYKTALISEVVTGKVDVRDVILN